MVAHESYRSGGYCIEGGEQITAKDVPFVVQSELAFASASAPPSMLLAEVAVASSSAETAAPKTAGKPERTPLPKPIRSQLLVTKAGPPSKSMPVQRSGSAIGARDRSSSHTSTSSKAAGRSMADWN